MNIMGEEGAVGNFSSEKWAVGEKRLGAHGLDSWQFLNNTEVALRISFCEQFAW